MPPVTGPTGPRDAAEGPPSEQARAALSERLRREVADARMRFEEAGLRAETHRLLGQHDAAADVVEEQERILADVQDRLGRAVSAAVVERDAEQVLADLVAAERLPQVEPAPVVAPDADRPRTPVLAGVTSLVAVLGLAVAATLGLTRGLDGVEVTEAAADSAPTDDAGDDEPTFDPGSVVVPRPGGDASAPATIGPPLPTAADASSPLAGPTAADETTDADDPTESPEPTPEPELGTVVQELIDAVAGLDEPGDASEDDTDVPEEYDASVPEVDEVVDQLDGDDGDTGGTTDGPGTASGDTGDGFVPGTTAE